MDGGYVVVLCSAIAVDEVTTIIRKAFFDGSANVVVGGVVVNDIQGFRVVTRVETINKLVMGAITVRPTAIFFGH